MDVLCAWQHLQKVTAPVYIYALDFLFTSFAANWDSILTAFCWPIKRTCQKCINDFLCGLPFLARAKIASSFQWFLKSRLISSFSELNYNINLWQFRIKQFILSQASAKHEIFYSFNNIVLGSLRIRELAISSNFPLCRSLRTGQHGRGSMERSYSYSQ